MARIHEVSARIRQGHRPWEIAEQLGIALSSTLGYIHRAVLERSLKASDVLHSVPQPQRQAIIDKIDSLPIPAGYPIEKLLEESGEDALWGSEEHLKTDIDVVLTYRYGGVVLGELYEDLREMETSLHKFIRQVLSSVYGPDEDQWWAEGIPPKVRVKCQERRELDPSRLEAYRYTDLLDLKDVIEKRWNVFGEVVAALGDSKKEVLSVLDRLNRVRNAVMHPVRGVVPDEDDFNFVRRISHAIQDVVFGYRLKAKAREILAQKRR